MRVLHLPSLVLSFALLGSPNVMAAQSDQNVQHLTCTRDPQGLMCTIDETQETVSLKNTKHSASAQNEDVQTKYSDQLEQISNGLLGLIFIGLPIVLVAAIVVQDKRDIDRTKRLEQLERIWHQS
ncbi:MAG: hypothetical protein C4288_11080 [Leptolyngbya sp. ERB_1_1]